VRGLVEMIAKLLVMDGGDFADYGAALELAHADLPASMKRLTSRCLSGLLLVARNGLPLWFAQGGVDLIRRRTSTSDPCAAETPSFSLT
jgi:hypothetical protein